MSEKMLCAGCLRKKPISSFDKGLRLRCNICAVCRNVVINKLKYDEKWKKFKDND